MKPKEKYNQLVALLSSFTPDDAQHFYQYELNSLSSKLENTNKILRAKRPRKEVVISEYSNVVEAVRKEFLLPENFMKKKGRKMFSTTPKQIALKIIKERIELSLGTAAKWRFMVAKDMGVNYRLITQHLEYADKKMSKSPLLVKRYNRIKSML